MIRTDLRPAAVLDRIAQLGDRRAALTGAGAGLRRSSVENGEFRMEYRGSRVLDVTIRGTIDDASEHCTVRLTFGADSSWLLGAVIVTLACGAEAWLGRLTTWQAVATAAACSGLFAALDLWVGPVVVTGRVSEWLATELHGERLPSTRSER